MYWPWGNPSQTSTSAGVASGSEESSVPFPKSSPESPVRAPLVDDRQQQQQQGGTFPFPRHQHLYAPRTSSPLPSPVPSPATSPRASPRVSPVPSPLGSPSPSFTTLPKMQSDAAHSHHLLPSPWSPATSRSSSLESIAEVTTSDDVKAINSNLKKGVGRRVFPPDTPKRPAYVVRSSTAPVGNVSSLPSSSVKTTTTTAPVLPPITTSNLPVNLPLVNTTSSETSQKPEELLDPDSVYQAFVRQWCFAQSPSTSPVVEFMAAPVHGDSMTPRSVSAAYTAPAPAYRSPAPTTLRAHSYSGDAKKKPGQGQGRAVVGF